jgi:hypothetical protein
MARADDHSPRARFNAAVELCGSTSSSNASAPPAGETRATAIQNDGAGRPGAAISTRQHTHRACWTWSGSSDNRTPSPKARRPLMDGGPFFIAGATTTTLSADLVLWNVVTIAEQPCLRSGIESVLD